MKVWNSQFVIFLIVLFSVASMLVNFVLSYLIIWVGWRSLTSSGNLSREIFLIDWCVNLVENITVDAQGTLKFHTLYNFRYDHLWGLKGIPVPAVWTRQLFSLEMSLFLPYNIFSQGLTGHPLSLVPDSPFLQGGRWILRTAVRAQPESTRGQWGFQKYGARPDLCVHPWKPVHYGHCWHGWVFPGHMSAGLWLLGCKKNIRNTRQPELIFHYSGSLGSGWKHIHFNPVFTAFLATVN